MKITSLGYLRVESPNAKEWATFGPEVLGLAVSEDLAGGPDTVSLTNDDRPGRLQISEGPHNRVQCIGWELPGAGDLADAVATLEQAGVTVERGTAEECRAAKVRQLVRFTDPAGFTHELFYGQLVVPGSFRPGRGTAGFVTRGQGLGHVVLVVPDLTESLDFFCTVLGFRVSDEIDFDGNTLVFLHVNPRHHSLAIMGIPGMRGLHHLMLQVEDLDDVGIAHQLVLDRQIPLAMTLGRHANDRMLSFYVRSPSGFEIEYGWGASTVDVPDQWVVTHMKSTSIWGHRPGDAPPPACLEPVSPPAS
ncbi:VOC family protein [Geodermatophilus ruber]|uniref:Extradiol dioxygenase n=1 Tax=Geodermatophilus ruber TaxID=504800 RepID=A0A1I4BPQ9_9ACTN|nr:VOC family protein [Geodermatophilus ruber]SFK69956.1 extradiol dioxygenase [Geodermatophilus ruber]